MDLDYSNYSKDTYCLIFVLRRQQTLEVLNCDWSQWTPSKSATSSGMNNTQPFFCACTFFLSVEMEVYFSWTILCENVHIQRRVNLSKEQGTN